MSASKRNGFRCSRGFPPGKQHSWKRYGEPRETGGVGGRRHDRRGRPGNQGGPCTSSQERAGGNVGHGSRTAARRETGRRHATEPYGCARRERCPGGNDMPREDRRRVGSGRGVGGPHRSDEGGERALWHPDPAEQRRPVSRENFRREPWPRAQTEGPPCPRDF